MSMISEQVKELRRLAEHHRDLSVDYFTAISLSEAADTIETLSAKLAAVNMERSERYYGGGWMHVNWGLPTKEECAKNDGRFIVTDGNRVYQSIFDFDNLRFFDYSNFGISIDRSVLYWMPLPEPYKPDGEVGE